MFYRINVMENTKYNLICVRHLQDQNVLKSYGLDGPLVSGQEEKITRAVETILETAKKIDSSRVRILYTDKTLRVKQTAEMLAEVLREHIDVDLTNEDRLDVFDQGEMLLPENYKDGEYFDPLMKAWDAVCDEAYEYRNIDYRFGSGHGFKKYPILAKSFSRKGESLRDLLIRQYSVLLDLLKGNFFRENEVLIICGQDMFILLIKELLELFTEDVTRPEDLPYESWKIYKERLQGENNDNTPFGNLISFNLSNIANSDFIELLTIAIKQLEDRKLISPSSIQGVINSTDNDFSEFDNEFKNQTGVAITSTEIINKEFGFYPISVVIPYYNSRSTILDVLQSIELQNLKKDEMKRVEVIIVNDGWKDDLTDAVDPQSYSFDLKIIICKENGGRSVARNIGAQSAKHDILMFLDADNLVSGECLREHSIRNRLVPNQLYTSLVANIFLEDVPKLTKSYFDKNIPLPIPSVLNEFRVKEEVRVDSVGIEKIKKNYSIEILKETNNFKMYGYGRMIAYYDLPSMYATYCVSVTKDFFDRVGGFSEKFKGWGMEDSFFGAEAIVRGAKIIPILSCGSYSVNLPSHSGSEEKEKEELKINIDRYNELKRKSL